MPTPRAPFQGETNPRSLVRAEISSPILAWALGENRLKLEPPITTDVSARRSVCHLQAGLTRRPLRCPSLRRTEARGPEVWTFLGLDFIAHSIDLWRAT